MNRTDRLMAMVLELQKRKKLRAEDFAETFETSVRTIYRDIQALSEPIMAVPGQGYSLMDGYFLPPVTFRAEEAAALLLGSDAIEPQLDAPLQASAHSSRAKLEAVLPQEVLAQVSELRSRLRFFSVPPKQQEKLGLLREVVMAAETVRFRYTAKARRDAADSMEPASRVVDPYGLVHASGIWYLIGHCHLRGSLRQFRLDRMEEAERTNRSFERPADFNIHHYEPSNDCAVTVRVRFKPTVAPRLRQSSYYYITDIAETEEGLYVTLRVRYEREIVHWLLGWGNEAVVLEPESLRRIMAEEAEKICELYASSAKLLT